MIKWIAIGELNDKDVELTVEALETATTFEVLGIFQNKYPDYSFCECSIRKEFEKLEGIEPKASFGTGFFDAFRPDAGVAQ